MVLTTAVYLRILRANVCVSAPTQPGVCPGAIGFPIAVVPLVAASIRDSGAKDLLAGVWFTSPVVLLGCRFCARPMYPAYEGMLSPISVRSERFI